MGIYDGDQRDDDLTDAPGRGGWIGCAILAFVVIAGFVAGWYAATF